MTAFITAEIWHERGTRHQVCVCLTDQVSVFGAFRVRQRHKLSEQQGIFQDPLNRFDKVRLQRRRVLIGWVPCLEEVLEGFVCLCCTNDISNS